MELDLGLDFLKHTCICYASIIKIVCFIKNRGFKEGFIQISANSTFWVSPFLVNVTPYAQKHAKFIYD